MRATGVAALFVALTSWGSYRPLQATALNPRAIAADALRAAERGTLDAWALPVGKRLARVADDREALFAQATANRLGYRYQRADALYARVIALRTNDAFARQAQLARIAMDAVQGRQLAAPALSLAVVQAALRNADTLTALDALLLRAGTVSRTEGAAAAIAVLMRGDSLSWHREPALDAAARCRKAAMYSRTGQRDVARQLAHQGEAIATKAGLERQAAGCLFTLATEFARAGLSDSLRGPLLKAIAIQERTGDMAGLAASNQWAGYYSISLGDFPSAQRFLSEAWRAAQIAGSREAQAWTALNRASLALSFFDRSAADTWLGRADSLMQTIGDRDGGIQVARMRTTLASATGDTASAHRYLRDAIMWASKLDEPLSQLGVLANGTELAMLEGRLNDAALSLRSEDSVITRYRLSGWRGTVTARQGELALRRGDGHEAARLIVSVLDSVDPSQQRYRHELQVQQALALAMTGDVQRAARVAMRAASTFDSWRASLSDSTLRLLTVQSQRDNGWYLSELIARLADAGGVETAFALAERRRARDLRERLLLASAWQQANVADPRADSRLWRETDSVDVRSLQRAIPDTVTALVSMDPGEAGGRGTAFVMTRGALTSHALPASNDVAPHVRRLVSLLEAGRDATNEQQVLGRMLMNPLMARLEHAGITRVVFIPEGVLHRLPFDVLRLADGHFVVERFETAVAPSARVFQQLHDAPTRVASAPRILAIADPGASRGASSRTSADSSFGRRLLEAVFGLRAVPSLAGARDEVTRVTRAFPGTAVRAGNVARESSVKRDAASYDVLHFATHAVVDEWSGSQAALALAADEREEGDDGLLDSGEIAKLHLSASLVMLSACRTIGGEVLAGEGVRGLTTAFLHAGARSVVATMWRIDDRAVGLLVGDFYDALATGAPVGRSLRTARLAAVRRGAPASVWGAFTIVGDPWQRIAMSR